MPTDNLSPKDAILALLAQGLKVGKVAQKLGLTRAQVWGYIYTMQRETKCSSLYQLMWAWGLKLGERAAGPRERASYLKSYYQKHKQEWNRKRDEKRAAAKRRTGERGL